MRQVSTQLLAKLQAGELVCFVVFDMEIDGEIFRYTDCDIPLVVDEHRYTPVPVEAGDVQHPAGNLVSSFSMKISANVEYDGDVSSYEYLKDVFVHGTPSGGAFIARLVFLNVDYYAAYAVNQLTNPGFESGILGDWSLGVYKGCNASASVIAVSPYKGTYCAKITITDGWGDDESSSAGGCDIKDILFQQNISPAISAGYLYDLSFAARAESARKIGADIGTIYGTNFPMFYNIDLTTSWQFFNLLHVAPEDISAGNAYVNFYLARENSNDDVYIDQVRFSNSLYPITMFKGYIDKWNLDEEWINVEIVNALAAWSRRTVRRQSSTCRWLKFKGTECQYSGGETWCDRTYARCDTLGNTAHFGGFRWIPSIIDKTIYWGRIPISPAQQAWDDFTGKISSKISDFKSGFPW